ncbi:MAG: hypothetical protein H8D23_07980 [Candidatus Brocadiales bacterium]|nr:hypothetical protein [Candidatus Brocadiales bacterium]
MISELENKITIEDEHLVAQSKFLEELRTLIAKYRSRIKELFFSDDFKDGNYTNNPKWIVKSGNFFVNEAGQLSNSVVAQDVEPATRSGKDKSLEKEAIGLVLDGIFGSKKKAEPERKPERPSQVVQPAIIYSQASISPDFEIDVEFISNSEMGEMEIVLLGSDNLTPRYRLNYKKNGSQERPIEIIRENNGRKFIIEAATKYPQIDDGTPHNVKWIRYKNGVMNVLIDNDIVLETHEVYFKNKFSGIEIQNNGGTYQWASLKISKASEQMQN